jgi:signal transduction histidine kinase
VAQLNSPLTLVDETLRTQTSFITLGILLTLIAGSIGGLFLTASALKPLRRMANTCRQIAAGDLHRRVALPHSKDEIAKFADAFNEMVSHLEKSFAAQRRFIGDAAHELKTPLAALQGSLEVLLRGAQDDAATARHLTQGMHRETLRLKRLVEQLLDLSRLDAPIELHLETIEIDTFLLEFVEQARMLTQNRRITLDAGAPAIVAADADSLKQSLFNLVDNAARHTSDGGRITFGWQNGANTVEIWVEDDGEGIADEDLPHIFEPFYRGGDRSRSRHDGGGTGLGLTLVQATIKAHGGRIEARSKPGAGSRFTLIFPVNLNSNSKIFSNGS